MEKPMVFLTRRYFRNHFSNWRSIIYFAENMSGLRSALSEHQEKRFYTNYFIPLLTEDNREELRALARAQNWVTIKFTERLEEPKHWIIWVTFKR